MMKEENKFDKVKYDNAFIAQNYDRINLTVPKGAKEDIKKHAESQGESVNGFINRAIREAMERDTLKKSKTDSSNSVSTIDQTEIY